MKGLSNAAPVSDRAVRVVLVAITDFDRVDEATLLSRAERLVHAAVPGTVALDLRDRTRPARHLLALGSHLARMAEAAQQCLVINERLDLALLLGADGVHLGEGAVETAEARQLIGALPVYRACHDPARAGQVDADVVLLSPVVAARKGQAALGVAALGEARLAIEQSAKKTRLLALGGVTAEEARRCLEAGADGVAAIGAVFDGQEPGALLKELGISR